MKIVELLGSQAVSADLRSGNKDDALAELLELLVKAGDIRKADTKEILSKLKDREVLGSTGIGKGIGIPHAKSASVKKMTAAMAISKKGIDFRSLDGEPTYILFLLLAPGETPGPHLKALAKISRLLDDKFVRDRLRSAKNENEMLKIVKEEEQKKG
ncbi:MAG: PTS sugar transporter subunit IIA [Candidatus Omnitrophota bacterium]|jgi:fructose-specific phosphotransferase system IIA component